MKLKQITIQGFKSFDQEGATIRFGDVTVLLGANGVGKSNVVSFLKMLYFMASESFQTYVAEEGFSDSILHYGQKVTDHINCRIEFEENNIVGSFEQKLYAAGDTILFMTETTQMPNLSGELGLNTIETPHKESSALRIWPGESPFYHSSVTFLRDLRRWHFNDTASNSKIRSRSDIHHNQGLNHEAGNLAAFLYALKENPKYHWHYNRIVREIRQAMPQFGDFVLFPDTANPNFIALNWLDNSNNPDYLFGPHQISDGSLRYMALTTLLLQPEELLPRIIVLDEPELGLHPTALAHLGGMIHTASQNCQVVIATQSQRLVDEFDIENIVILERDSLRNATVASYKTEEELRDWLEEYSLSELWEKNVIGGQP
jgi:predicted ATPase